MVEAKIGKSRGQAGGWIVTVARAQEGNRINEMCHGALAESVASALEVGKGRHQRKHRLEHAVFWLLFCLFNAEV